MRHNLNVETMSNESAPRTRVEKSWARQQSLCREDGGRLWYVDRHVRTSAGWRIAERIEQRCYTFNVPGGGIEAIAAAKE